MPSSPFKTSIFKRTSRLRLTYIRRSKWHFEVAPSTQCPTRRQQVGHQPKSTSRPPPSARQATPTPLVFCCTVCLPALVRAPLHEICSRSQQHLTASHCPAAARPPSPRARLAAAQHQSLPPPRPAACARASAFWQARRCATLSAAYGPGRAPCGSSWLGRGSAPYQGAPYQGAPYCVSGARQAGRRPSPRTTSTRSRRRRTRTRTRTRSTRAAHPAARACVRAARGAAGAAARPAWRTSSGATCACAARPG